jgi:DNA primase
MSNVWQEIKDRLSVEEVIQDYIPVISQGNTYKALCPFHREKSPSFIINKEKGIWHCFGCGQGGDIFAFVCEIENITRKEALEKLAKKAGVKLEKRSDFNQNPQSVAEEQATTSNFEQGLKLLEWTAEVYHRVLLKIIQDRDNPISQYCINRGLTLDIITQFKLGYAPKGNFILELVKKHNLNQLLMLEIGVLKNKAGSDSDTPENNQVNPQSLADKFTDRLMIPVLNRSAKIVGFTGRVFPYDKTERPKYLNSAQSMWFNKSDLWFGWNLAKTKIIQEKKALIVEGNMDVISSFKHNFTFTLASQGTSFTENQLKVLKTITRTVWLAFDNDDAGKISSDKFFKSAGFHGIAVYKVVIPKNYKDLDEYLSDKKPDTLEVIPYLDWILSEKHSMLISSDSDLQKKAILEVLDLMQNLDAISKEQYLKKLADTSRISINTLVSFLPESKTTVNSFVEEGDNIQKLSLEQATYSSWQNLLAGVLINFPERLELMSLSFRALSKILPQLASYQDFQDYLDQNMQILSFICEQKTELKEPTNLAGLWRQVSSYLDSRFAEFMLDQELKEIYLTMKKSEFL